MSRERDIKRLQEIAQMARDHQLANLHGLADRRAQSLMQIAVLDSKQPETDLPLVSQGVVGLRYQAWADSRRETLNLVLARQTAEWLTAREDARRAFGRVEALRRLADKGLTKP